MGASPISPTCWGYRGRSAAPNPRPSPTSWRSSGSVYGSKSSSPFSGFDHGSRTSPYHLNHQKDAAGFPPPPLRKLHFHLHFMLTFLQNNNSLNETFSKLSVELGMLLKGNGSIKTFSKKIKKYFNYI